MLAEERLPAPATSRRALLTAALAAPLLAASLSVQATAEPDLNDRYERMVADYNGLPLDTPEDVGDAAFVPIGRLDDDIAKRPCLTAMEARAKIAHAIRGLELGERGTEVDALRQVIAFLERA